MVILTIAALIVCGLGMISCLIPLRFLGIRTRPIGFVVFVVGLMAAVLFAGAIESPPPPLETTTGSQATIDDAADSAEGAGQFRSYAYTYLKRTEGTMFFFTPALPRSDDNTLMAAMEHVLRASMGVEGRLTNRVVPPAVRFIAGSGVFDVMPVREQDGGPVTALLVQRR